jgi:hypothetical protein
LKVFTREIAKSENPAREGAAILLAALETGETAGRIFGELRPLLLPDGPREYNDESGKLLAKEINNLALKGRGMLFL